MAHCVRTHHANLKHTRSGRHRLEEFESICRCTIRPCCIGMKTCVRIEQYTLRTLKNDILCLMQPALQDRVGYHQAKRNDSSNGGYPSIDYILPFKNFIF